MKKRLVIAAVAVIVLVGAFLVWRAVRRPSGPTFETAAVDRGAIIAKVTASGTLSAVVTVQVGSQVSGRIAEIKVDFNSSVKKGQLIARIDPELFQAAVEQARANLAAAKGNLEKARAQAVDADRQAKRNRALAEQKLVAEADAETAEANAEAARAAVAAANGAVQQAVASLHQADVNLAYTAIVSPTSGTVISRNVDVGQTVAASLQAPTLFVIAEDLKRMQVDTSVAEADVGKLRDGMDATFTVDAYPGEKFRGKVRQIRNSPQTVQNVVTYDAVIDVENPELKLRPGMTANITFVWADEEDVLRVPNSALRFRPPPGALPLPPSRPRGDGGAGPQLAANDRPSGAGRARAADGFPAGATPVVANNGASGARPAGDAGRGDRDSRGRRMLWVLRQGKPVSVLVRTGISDGTLTEVLEGDLSPGDACIVDMDLGKRGSGGPPGGGPPGGMRRMF
jgi:HlyD family secretion protein